MFLSRAIFCLILLVTLAPFLECAHADQSGAKLSLQEIYKLDDESFAKAFPQTMDQWKFELLGGGELILQALVRLRRIALSEFQFGTGVRRNTFNKCPITQ